MTTRSLPHNYRAARLLENLLEEYHALHSSLLIPGYQIIVDQHGFRRVISREPGLRQRQAEVAQWITELRTYLNQHQRPSTHHVACTR